MTSNVLEVLDQGTPIRISFQDMLKYHGPAYPGGVAHALKVMERAFPLLDPKLPPERREIVIETAFPGPGARDAFEMVTRAVTGDRYVVDPALERTERGTTLERYVFRLRYRARAVTVVIREGYVTDEFIALSRKPGRTAEEEEHLAVLKQEMADRLTAAPAAEVYEVEGAT
jgi:hypothetical protein